jgi:hypothetical protein
MCVLKPPASLRKDLQDWVINRSAHRVEFSSLKLFRLCTCSAVGRWVERGKGWKNAYLLRVADIESVPSDDLLVQQTRVSSRLQSQYCHSAQGDKKVWNQIMCINLTPHRDLLRSLVGVGLFC